MKKNVLLFSMVMVASLGLAACGVGTDRQVDQAQETNTRVEGEVKDQELGSFSGSIQDMIASNKAQKCTWQQEGTSMGTVYTDGKRSFVESSVVLGEKTVESYILSDGEIVYIWEKGATEGVKMSSKDMPVDESVESNLSDNPELTESEQAAKDEEENQMSVLADDLKLECQDWKVDSSKFIAPTSVKFVDLNQALQEVRPSADQLGAICDSLSGEEKQECLMGLEKLTQ
ncbi:MAG: hypothetical protein ACOZAN_00460 [Patescibacteria group bacterium]